VRLVREERTGAHERRIGTTLVAFASVLVALNVAGCRSASQIDSSQEVAHAAPAAVVGGVDHTAVVDDPISEIAPTAERPDERAQPRRTAPPRMHGKTYNTAVVDEAGRVRNVEIRMRDGDAETRIDGKVVPREQVLVHRRGFVRIVDEQGQDELLFNLPRGMTSLTMPKVR